MDAKCPYCRNGIVTVVEHRGTTEFSHDEPCIICNHKKWEAFVKVQGFAKLKKVKDPKPRGLNGSK